MRQKIVAIENRWIIYRRWNDDAFHHLYLVFNLQFHYPSWKLVFALYSVVFDSSVSAECEYRRILSILRSRTVFFTLFCSSRHSKYIPTIPWILIFSNQFFLLSFAVIFFTLYFLACVCTQRYHCRAAQVKVKKCIYFKNFKSIGNRLKQHTKTMLRWRRRRFITRKFYANSHTHSIMVQHFKNFSLSILYNFAMFLFIVIIVAVVPF